MSTIQITKPKTEIDPEILAELCMQVDEEGQVVLHILFDSHSLAGTFIRIWPSSYLYDCGSDHVSELVHCINIVKAPQWQYVDPLGKCHFTLVFSGLPRSCDTFDFVEHCGTEAGGFEMRSIVRSASDVYYFKIY